MAVRQFFVREYAVSIKRRREDDTHFNLQETLGKKCSEVYPFKKPCCREICSERDSKIQIFSPLSTIYFSTSVNHSGVSWNNILQIWVIVTDCILIFWGLCNWKKSYNDSTSIRFSQLWLCHLKKKFDQFWNYPAFKVRKMQVSVFHSEAKV